MEFKAKFERLDGDNVIGSINEQEYTFKLNYENKIKFESRYEDLVETLTKNVPDVTFNLSEIENAFKNIIKLKEEEEAARRLENIKENWERANALLLKFNGINNISLIGKDEYIKEVNTPSHYTPEPKIKYTTSAYSDELQKNIEFIFSIGSEKIYGNGYYSSVKGVKLVCDKIKASNENYAPLWKYGMDKGTVKKPSTMIRKCDDYVKCYIAEIEANAKQAKIDKKNANKKEAFINKLKETYEVAEMSYDKKIKLIYGPKYSEHITVSENEDKIKASISADLTEDQLKRIMEILKETSVK